jgi:hypothetical protein
MHAVLALLRNKLESVRLGACGSAITSKTCPSCGCSRGNGSYTVMTCTTFNASNINEDQDKRLTHTMYGS